VRRPVLLHTECGDLTARGCSELEQQMEQQRAARALERRAGSAAPAARARGYGDPPPAREGLLVGSGPDAALEKAKKEAYARCAPAHGTAGTEADTARHSLLASCANRFGSSRPSGRPNGSRRHPVAVPASLSVVCPLGI
jgi:hypothetical protein